MAGRLTLGVRTLALVLAAGLAAGLVACDRPGPLSAAAHRALPPAPTAPAWSAPLRGQLLKSAFPGEMRCIGAIDGFSDRYLGARRANGWVWSLTRSQAPAHLAVVNPAGRMVGFGESGIDRPDVPAARPEVRSRTAGWTAVTPTRKPRYTLYGLDEASRSACVVGELRP